MTFQDKPGVDDMQLVSRELAGRSRPFPMWVHEFQIDRGKPMRAF